MSVGNVSAAGLPTLDDVNSAAAALSDVAVHTPLLTDAILDEVVGSVVHTKAEFLQRGGAYKFRGMYNAIRLMSDEDKRRGMVTASSGNAGIAAAYAARLHQVPCLVVMPAKPAPQKVAAIEALGAELTYFGTTSREMTARARELAAEGRCFVHPFDQREVIAGHATMALELLEQADDLDVLVVPTGGGGMLGGVALVVHELRPNVELVGVQPEGAAGVYESLAAGAVKGLEHVDTVAEGLAVQRCGDLTFELIRRHVSDVLLVSDDEILDAVALYWRVLHVPVEPSGAAALAAVRRYSRFRGQRIGVVASGGNVNVALLQHALQGGTANSWKADHRS